jgi:hypothetical protein
METNPSLKLPQTGRRATLTRDQSAAFEILEPVCNGGIRIARDVRLTKLLETYSYQLAVLARSVTVPPNWITFYFRQSLFFYSKKVIFDLWYKYRRRCRVRTLV